MGNMQEQAANIEDSAVAPQPDVTADAPVTTLDYALPPPAPEQLGAQLGGTSALAGDPGPSGDAPSFPNAVAAFPHLAEDALPEPHTPWGDAFNGVVNAVTAATGYDTHRVTDVPGGPDDNSFYRDNAQYMPGWGNTLGLGGLDPHGLPSGATAQDRATNYVGNDDPTGVWGDVRQRLVQYEGADIDALPKGPDGKPQGNISFGDVYDAHVRAFHDAQLAARESGKKTTANNPFVDPASMAIAVYGAPLLEHLGIDAGPTIGASIDYFNDPTDSATAGWAKRMALSGAEIAAGTVVPGLAGLGASSARSNTASAVRNGMLGEIGGSIERAAGVVTKR